jgi:S-formylglutathione hydrolase FrmB
MKFFRTYFATLFIALLAIITPATAVFAQNFDHSYTQYDAQLKKHVKFLPDGKQSRVNYKGLAADHAELTKTLDSFSAVTPAQFATFNKEQQMAFLINAYNAFTIELILSKYPDVKSIKDLGSTFSSPWKKTFFKLLGEERNLDWIEHDKLRPTGKNIINGGYQDPRIHFAIVCASIGCPALPPEAFTAAKLDAQLDAGMARFVLDKTRNRFEGGKLQVSSIFKWFKDDFEKGYKGFGKVEDVFAKYADNLSNDSAIQGQLRAKTVSISYLDYDWSLNDSGR